VADVTEDDVVAWVVLVVLVVEYVELDVDVELDVVGVELEGEDDVVVVEVVGARLLVVRDVVVDKLVGDELDGASVVVELEEVEVFEL
jgi:hypothetical protein